MKLTTAANRYVVEHERRGAFARSTAQSYRYVLGRFTDVVGDVDTEDLTRRHVARWLGSLECGPSTTRCWLSTVQTFTKWLVLNGYTPSDPGLGFTPPRQPQCIPRAMPAEDVTAVLEVCPDARARLIALLMVQAALRCCEVSRLQVGDVDLRDRALLVRGKGDKQRVVPISEELLESILEYLDELPATAGPLVRSMKDPHAGITPGYIGQRMTAWMYAAGVKHAARDGRSAHAFRHTCATDMLRQGADVRELQLTLGHSSLQHTQRYLGWRVEGLRRAVEGRRYRPTSARRYGGDVPSPS